jgi:Tfp pilus assembly protein PilV
MNGIEIGVLASTIAVFAMSCGLAALITMRYAKGKRQSHAFWGAGMWTFAFSVFLEIVFALGIYSRLLISIYLFSVVLLVVLLALGSIQLVKSRYAKTAFHFFAALSLAYALYSIMTSSPGSLVSDYVVYGLPPMPIVISSSIATSVSAVVIAAVALAGYARTRNARLLSIVAGVVVVSVAGTMYIASFPAFLYYAEFAGILLLWIGFV